MASLNETFGKWNARDFDDYVDNKKDIELKYQQTGKWDSDLVARNQELRNKYNMTEDKYSYNDLGEYRFDTTIFPAWVEVGKKSDNPIKNIIADKLESQMLENQKKYKDTDTTNNSSYSSSNSIISSFSSFVNSGSGNKNIINAIFGIGILYIFLSFGRR